MNTATRSCWAIVPLLPLLLLASPASAAPLPELLAAADAEWGGRAEGSTGATAKPARVERSAALCREALAADPGSLEARWRLVRALWFRAVYCGANVEERKKLLGEAKKAGDEGVARLERGAGGAKGGARIEAFRREPAAARVCFWTAAAWGEWALAYGKMAAAREGAASTIRDLAETVIALDPALEDAGGARILGRLHAESPKIPFLTGWVSRDAAIANLRKALAAAPASKMNRRFLAEALLEYEPKSAKEARALLETCASEPPRSELQVEEAREIELAREKLVER
jgi:hypothetical protein